MINTIVMFFKNYYAIAIVWAVVTITPALWVNSCNQKEIRRLKSIVKIEDASHKKEMQALKDYHDKYITEMKKIEERYGQEFQKLSTQYDHNLKQLEVQQKNVYESYVKNQDLMSEMLKKYFNLRGVE